MLEKSVITSAIIDGDIVGLFFYDADFDVVEVALSDFANSKVPLDDAITNFRSDSKCDLFITFKDQFKIEVQKICDESHYSNVIDDNAVLIKIRGSGFTRAYDFTSRILGAFSKRKINILAQMCSDVEMFLYVASDDPLDINRALNDLDIKILI